MGRKSVEKPKIPSITWSQDLVWNLISFAQLADNRNVLLGKNRDDKTTPDNKTKVFKRIAETLLPAIFALDPESAANRTSSKWDSLKKTYREQAARLHQTGGGLRGDEGNSNPHEYSDCYIAADGPDATTTPSAKNLWNQIISEFIYFPDLHRLLSTRPSLVPPAITTGVGPHGQKIVHYQAPTTQARAEHDIDPYFATVTYDFPPLPSLHAAAAAANPAPAVLPPASAPALLHIDKENVPVITKTPMKAPKQSSFGSTKLDDAVQKARETLKPLGSKRTSNGVEDMFTEISRKTYELTQARYKEEVIHKRRKLDLEERQLLLRELEAGLINNSEYRKLRGLGDKKGKKKARSPTPHHSSTPPTDSRPSTPEWDYGRLDKDMAESSENNYRSVFEIDSDAEN